MRCNVWKALSSDLTPPLLSFRVNHHRLYRNLRGLVTQYHLLPRHRRLLKHHPRNYFNRRPFCPAVSSQNVKLFVIILRCPPCVRRRHQITASLNLLQPLPYQRFPLSNIRHPLMLREGPSDWNLIPVTTNHPHCPRVGLRETTLRSTMTPLTCFLKSKGLHLWRS